VEAGNDHRLADAVRFKRIELAVEQTAAAELDQALRPVVHKVSEAAALPGRKDDRLVHSRRHCLSNAAAIGH